MNRRTQRPLTWLALVAMLALAVLPAVSHALAFARGAGGSLLELCTTQGMRLVVVDSDSADPGAPVQAATHLEHCPLCALSGSGLAPPPAPMTKALLPSGIVALPALFLHAPRTLFAWRSAQPRGPPSLT